MHPSKRRVPGFLLALLLVFLLSQTVLGAEPDDGTFAFLAELARIENVPGYSPALFRPEQAPSRFEIAFFLFLLDQRLAKAARPGRADLQYALRHVWLRANPQSDTVAAADWAAAAALSYRRLLVEYNREMGALGYRLRPDAHPYWSGGARDVPGY